MSGVVGATVALVAEEAFAAASEGNMGWCHVCGDFTRENTEPDAEGYDCPDCGRLVVCGADQALLCGIIELSADPLGWHK